MRVLVTGARGFIGSYLVSHFAKEHDVVALVRPGPAPELDRLKGLPITILQHNLREKFDAALEFDLILHSGGNPSSASALADPYGAVLDNVLGTTNVLELARKNKASVVYYSTSEVFGAMSYGIEAGEDDIFKAFSPYGSTKAAAEELCRSYAISYDMKINVIHINNAFGERVQAERFPALVMRKVLNNEVVQITTGSTGIISGRRWYHADDLMLHTDHVLDAKLTNYEKWNSAGNRFVDNLEFAKLIAQAMGKPLQYELISVARIGHLNYAVDPKKLYDTGFKDTHSIEQRVQQMVDWTLQNKEWL